MDGYSLSRDWFDFAFNNPEKMSPDHTAIYFLAVELWNRFGQKEKFGFPAYNNMETLGIRNHRTYKKYFDDLIEWGFIKIIQESKNQYTACVIALVKNTKANTKANDKALTKHGHSTASIDKLINNKTIQIDIISKDIEQSSEKIEKYGNERLNNLQSLIKKEVLANKLIYKPGKYERSRLQNILTGKEIGETCEIAKMTREQFCMQIINLSMQIPFWKGKISNAETLYAFYAKVYNEAVKTNIEKKEPQGVKTW